MGRIWSNGNSPALNAANLNAMEADIAAAVRHGDIVFNVRDYGAKNDATASAATLTAIKNAIAAATAAGAAAVVYFPAGTYTVNGTIPITANVKICGAGDRTTTIQLDNATNADMFQIATGVTGFYIQDIKLWGNNGANTSGNGINFLDDTGSSYLGTGRISKVNTDSFANNGIRFGTHRNMAYLESVVSGNNAQYGIYLGTNVQDTLILSPDLGKNALAGLYVNGSNNTLTGGTVYGGTNLIVEDINTSKFICTGTVLEGCNQDGIVINTGAGDDVNTHNYIGITMGRIGLSAPASYSAFKSSTAARLIVSGHVYKRTADTAPAYIFNVPATCVVNMAGLLVQAGGYGTALSANGLSAFQGATQTPADLYVTTAPGSYYATLKAFTVMPLPTAPTVDTASGFSTSTYGYTVPVTGMYAVAGKIRLGDAQSNGVNCAIAVTTATADTTDEVWLTTGPNRSTLPYSDVRKFNKGDVVHLLYYIDGTVTTGVTFAAMSMTLLSAI